MHIGFIGAGKVGFTLGKYFSENGLDVSGFYSQSHDSARAAAEFVGSEFFGEVSDLVSVSDCIFITVPDDTISGVFRQISGLDLGSKLICHCSGSLTADEAFPGISSTGARGCSIHPLFPVSDKYESYKSISKAYFCIEGDERGCSEWSEILSGIGNPVRMISGSSKTKYHAACAISSNLVCALVQESTELLAECGFSDEEALSALRPLVMSNIENVLATGPVNALTGPVERCDVSTVQRHLNCFSLNTDKEMYRQTSLKLVEVAEKKHPDTDYSGMIKVLEDNKNTGV